MVVNGESFLKKCGAGEGSKGGEGKGERNSNRYLVLGGTSS